jgi:membrane-associated phospholipid phosphatase
VPRLRSSEWLVVSYFTYVAIVAAFFRIPLRPLGLAVLIAALVCLLSYTNSLLRDLIPLGYTIAAYREMNYFTPAIYNHRLEHAFIVWDRWLLDGWHLRAAIEYGGPPLPAFFEVCYLLVYAVGPVAVALLFLNHRQKYMNRFWIAYLAGTLGAYALFPYFPSEPPRTAFAGVDLPRIETLVRHLNLFIVGSYGIHSSVFPSAHVSSAMSAAWGLMAAIPKRRWIGGLMLFYGLCVTIATIYGRYHYAADSIAGMIISLLALIVLHFDKSPPRQEPYR